jgi:hypothetical protein
MKVLITPATEKAICFWCRGRKKECVTTEFSNGFLKNKTLCFDCLERATRVQFANESVANAARKGDTDATATESVPESKGRS